MTTKWLCEDCYNGLDGDYEIYTIPNAFDSPCTFCGKLAKYLVVLKEKQVSELPDGGYLIAKEDLPELLRQTFLVAQQLLGVFAFRLLCEATEQEMDRGGGENGDT